MMDLKSEVRDFPVTYSLIILSVSFFILQETIPDFTSSYAFFLGRSAFKLVYTSITYVFLHTGIGHLAGNMVGLWFLGRNAEELIGSVDTFSLVLFTTVTVPILVGFAQAMGLVPVRGVVGISAVVLAFAGLILVLEPYASASRPGKKISRKFEGWKKHFLKSADSVMIWTIAILLINAFHVLENSSYLGHVMGGLFGLAIGLMIKKNVFYFGRKEW